MGGHQAESRIEAEERGVSVIVEIREIEIF